MKVSDTPKVTDTLIELFKIDMETQKDNPQGNASLAGAEFTWKYYASFYNKDKSPAEATRTWVTKTIAETDSDRSTTSQNLRTHTKYLAMAICRTVKRFFHLER